LKILLGAPFYKGKLVCYNFYKPTHLHSFHEIYLFETTYSQSIFMRLEWNSAHIRIMPKKKFSDPHFFCVFLHVLGPLEHD
jgi:hypothetical protein